MEKIISIKDSIIKINSSKTHFINQMVLFDNQFLGIIVEIDNHFTYILVDSDKNINLLSTIKTNSTPWEVVFKEEYLNKIIWVNSDVLHHKKAISKKEYQAKKLFSKAPLFYQREPLNEPLKTGLFAIDTLIPIGKGQRELIIGDRKTGKTSIAISTIINQIKQNIKVIYVSIGQRQSALNEVKKIFDDHNASDFITIINASAELKLSQYIAPYLGMAIAESIASNNEDVLIIFDDLSKHANMIREISLNLGKSGGREAYPSDLFYSHSKLLERSGKFKEAIGGGSITALPIIETIEGDFSTILATNIISITDGQIMTDYKKAKNSIYPAIDIGFSVSRTGNSVQNKLLKSISTNISKIYSSYISSQKYELISLEISSDIKNKIIKGQTLNEAFTQFGYQGFDEKRMFLLAKLIEMNLFNHKNTSSKSFYNKIMEDKAGAKIMNKFIENQDKYQKLFVSYCNMILNKDNMFNGKRILSKEEGDYE